METLNQLLPAISALPHAEKLQLMQWVAEHLTKEEGVETLAVADVPVRSPYDSFDAAEAARTATAVGPAQPGSVH
jgi:hypothetical protein